MSHRSHSAHARPLPRARRLAPLAAAIALTAGLTACGDDAPRSGEEPSSRTSAAAESSPAGESPSSSPSPSVAPATGPEVVTDAFTLRVPEMPAPWVDWILIRPADAQTFDEGTGANIQVSVRSSAETFVDNLDEGAETALEVNNYDKVERLPNITVAGEEAWNITGSDKDKTYFEVGGLRDGVEWSFSIDLPVTYTDRDAFIAQVLASVTWKS